jgi:hypothetical protein
VADQKPPKPARDMSAILQRARPLASQAEHQRPKPARADRHRLLAQHLAGRRVDRRDGVRALVHVGPEHNHPAFPSPRGSRHPAETACSCGCGRRRAVVRTLAPDEERACRSRVQPRSLWTTRGRLPRSRDLARFDRERACSEAARVGRCGSSGVAGPQAGCLCWRGRGVGGVHVAEAAKAGDVSFVVPDHLGNGARHARDWAGVRLDEMCGGARPRHPRCDCGRVRREQEASLAGTRVDRADHGLDPGEPARAGPRDPRGHRGLHATQRRRDQAGGDRRRRAPGDDRPGQASADAPGRRPAGHGERARIPAAGHSGCRGRPRRGGRVGRGDVLRPRALARHERRHGRGGPERRLGAAPDLPQGPL